MNNKNLSNSNTLIFRIAKIDHLKLTMEVVAMGTSW